MRKILGAIITLPLIMLPAEIYLILWLLLKPVTVWQKVGMCAIYFLFFWNGQRILIMQWIDKYLTGRGQ